MVMFYVNLLEGSGFTHEKLCFSIVFCIFTRDVRELLAVITDSSMELVRQDTLRSLEGQSSYNVRKIWTEKVAGQTFSTFRKFNKGQQ